MFRQWRARAQHGVSRSEAQELLIAAEDAIFQRLSQGRIDSDERYAKSVSVLLDAIADVDAAVVRIGALVIVKCTDESGRTSIGGRTLSSTEVKALERLPELHKVPSEFFDRLALAVSATDLPDAIGDVEAAP
jgi:hypothetical protein